jgi:hypothetical protein
MEELYSVAESTEEVPRKLDSFMVLVDREHHILLRSGKYRLGMTAKPKRGVDEHAARCRTEKLDSFV